MFVQMNIPRGGVKPFCGSAKPAKEVSREMGYRSDTIAMHSDMGPLGVGALLLTMGACWFTCTLFA